MQSVKVNYDRLTDGVLAGHAGAPLLLHTCCAPCASAVTERLLHAGVRPTLFFYNPNIIDADEHARRVEAVQSLCAAFKVPYIVEPYAPGPFLDAARGRENEREGGTRCGGCFSLRLHETARRAASDGFALFTSTLTIGPRKSAAAVNRAGADAADAFGGIYVPADFKKRGGYLRSIELSKELGLYRQAYCGCKWSVRT